VAICAKEPGGNLRVGEGGGGGGGGEGGGGGGDGQIRKGGLVTRWGSRVVVRRGLVSQYADEGAARYKRRVR